MSESDERPVPQGREGAQGSSCAKRAARRDRSLWPLVAWDRLLMTWGVWTGTLHARLLLWCAGCPCGAGLRADGRAVLRMDRRGAIRLGRGVQLNSRRGSNRVGLSGPSIVHCLGEGRIEIGDGSGLSGAVLSSRASIAIGRHVKIGGNARIFDHDFHALDARARRERRADEAACAAAPVRIGDDVLIGVNAIVLKGVTIGDRAVVGAGAVVICDVPAGEVWAGNPARRIRAAPGDGAP